MQNVNPSFNIQAPVIYAEPAQLFVEAGPMGISFVILNTGNFFQAVVIYAFSDKMNPGQVQEEIHAILQQEPILKKQYRKTHIFWAWPESILVPPEFMNEEKSNEMLDLVYGDAKKSTIKTDFLYKHNLHNIYRVPEAIRESFDDVLPYASQTHQYSLIVNREMHGGDELFVVFYTNSLTLMLCKENQLQVVQNFSFSSPEDTAYHLLHVCRSFYVQPTAVKLILSGMIDKKSNLFNAIYKYFLNIEFDSLPSGYTYVEDIKIYPPHFFSHLFISAACV